MLKFELNMDILLIWALVVLLLVAMAFVLWDVHYFLRTAFTIGYSYLFEKTIKPDEETTIYGFCSTNDLDIIFKHMNNARYVRELDFARFHFYYQTGLYRRISGSNSNILQTASHIRYRRTITLFSVFKVTTKLVYWDEKDLYLEQKFITLNDGFVRAVALSKQSAIGISIPEVMGKLLDKDSSYRPTPPEELKHWQACMEVSSSKLKKKD